MTDNEKLEYLEREIAEAEQLLDEINRAEREMHEQRNTSSYQRQSGVHRSTVYRD